MAKLLTEEEYSALVADRERLEWMEAFSAEWDDGHLSYYRGGTKGVLAGSLREAIDKARGVVK